MSFTPLYLKNLTEYKREHDPKASNEFSYTRFLTPYLAGYEGKALYLDCDTILRTDVKELFDQIDEEDVMVVQHDYTPKDDTKYLGAVQYAYPRKNWSSVMLFNCEKCWKLTPDYINTASPKELHRLYWAENIGELDKTWNHLVGEYEENPGAKLVHWTNGTPCFAGYQWQEHASEWFKLREEVNGHA